MKLIFGNSEVRYVYGISYFGDDYPGSLDLLGLKKLLEMKSLDLLDKGDGSPSVGDFLNFLEKNKQYGGKLLGYVSKDGKVVLEGMYFVVVKDSQFPVDFVNDFCRKFSSATSFSASPDRLYCWWNLRI
jgi:hypothetical protein